MITEFPKPGYYYHYKHDVNGPIENYAYEVLNVGHHTEIDGEDGLMVIYRPLYASAYVYRNGRMWDVRPLKMFMELVDKPEYKGPRFIPITDHLVIAKLKEIEIGMYND